MNWIDVSIIILIFISAINGLIKGFIITAFNLVGYIVAGIIAKVYYPFLASYIKNNTGVFDRLNQWLKGKVDGLMNATEGATDTNSIMDGFKLPSGLKEGMTQNMAVQNQLADADSSLGGLFSSSLSDILISIISIIIVFIVARIALAYLIKLLDVVAKLPVLKQFNKLSGLVLGILIGILIIHIAFAILTPIIITTPDGSIAQATYDSQLGQYFYTNNLIIRALKENGIIN